MKDHVPLTDPLGQVVITETGEGIFVQHTYADPADLAQSAVTLVRSIAETLRKTNPAAHEYFARWIARAATEGDVTAIDLEKQ